LDADAPAVTGVHFGIVVDTPEDVEPPSSVWRMPSIPLMSSAKKRAVMLCRRRFGQLILMAGGGKFYTVLEDVEDRNDASACCADESAAVELATAR